ncbi:class I SAM-dependent methyltransferase [Candidatus Parcubacteria bacterium]|nr:class I SAM-dependent methyltransferase [Candidatus Parcubacteria bacterium]
MKKSTSIHSLNADRGLNPLVKLAYLFLNWANNLFPYARVDKRIDIRSFGGEEWKEHLGSTFEASSVGRRLSDLFWRTLPWEEIKEELGEIHIFDTGCGQGNYATRLLDASGGRVDSYTGVDAKRRENWSKLKAEHKNFSFIQSTSSDILPLTPKKANMFVTQSAIEHFDEDVAFFEQIRSFVASTDKPVIQIHNFPAKAILPLYLFHGVRQYTPRNISKITRLFGDDTKFYLYGLGGEAGKKVQWKHFTWPLLLKRGKATFDKDLKKYNAEVVSSIEQDVKQPSSSPIFWVLIIHSHPKKAIW